MDDLISRQAAIDALWKAMFKYECETEERFRESDELDIGAWIEHRVFAQNMSDIDRQTILNLPSAQPEIIRCKECKHWGMHKSLNVPWCFEMHIDKSEDGYCDSGDRREDE